MSLQTPTKIQMLQNALHEKAKSQPDFRFYSLWDKVYRMDFLQASWKRVKANKGSSGVDGQTIEQIENLGVERWLGEISEELRSKTYSPLPLRRVWIPKPNGDRRPLSIPTVKDRLVQMAVTILLAPIFEADLHHRQYGYRPVNQ
ncbi:MAG: hypothetical protein HRU19_08480 [Pseudobacteriovorax sp.]|nr:hypothetical protein [Pseudobacteriovorax sp.]